MATLLLTNRNIFISFFHQKLKMKIFPFLTSLLFFIVTNSPPTKSFEVAVNGGIGVGVTIGGGGGGTGVWIGGNNGSPTPRLNRAYTALQSWKSAITSDPLGILTTWVGPNVCSYRGVFCAQVQDETTSSPVDIVAGIDLNHANLGGTLVKELSFLTEITLFHLNTNRFSGTVPESFRELSSLQELDLSNNLFSGPFPIQALYIPNLMYLDLRFNDFHGPIPEDLFNKKLDAIFLNNNHFEGEIPQNLGNSPASIMNFGHNRLSGVVPDFICSLKSLVNLTVSFNFFSGLKEDCSSSSSRNNVVGNLGFDFSGNCIPGKDLQRPRPECNVIPGGSLNCFRIPSIVKPLVCGTLGGRTESDLSSSPP
ncbi:hypothetical protein IC582_003023 [Cucumis melo]